MLGAGWPTHFGPLAATWGWPSPAEKAMASFPTAEGPRGPAHTPNCSSPLLEHLLTIALGEELCPDGKEQFNMKTGGEMNVLS